MNRRESILPGRGHVLAAFLATLALALVACNGANPSASPAPSATTAPSASPAPTATQQAAGSPAFTNEPLTIHVLEDPIEFTTVPVGSLTGCGKTSCHGDQLIGRSRMLDAATRKEIGTFLVDCFLVDPGQNLYHCPANTITLTGRGQIVFTETLLFRKATREEWARWAPWPIIGGTGEFLGATGDVDSPADSTWSYGDFVITITR